MNKRIKIVWICHFSDSKTRACISFQRIYLLGLLKKLFGRPVIIGKDFAVWISNAIKEFERFTDIDLTIIFPHDGIKGRSQSFTISGINYVCYRSQDDTLRSFLRRHLNRRSKPSYRKDQELVCSIIDSIKPDVVHLIGAENPYYSSTCLNIPRSIPCLLSLQTLMSAPGFMDHYPISRNSYIYRSSVERDVILRCDYIAIGVHNKEFIDVIRKLIKPSAVFLRLSLALGVDVDLSPHTNQYDFVYFAANISKACDDAIESFAILLKDYPSLTLNISGAYSPEYKAFIESRIGELGICDNVFITGPLNTHHDVITQIKKARFALLPLKVDLISGTIREAMANGLPVVTTITSATPDLNRNRKSVLLAEKGDFQGMANHMKRLVSDSAFSEMIRSNAFQTVQEDYSNKSFMMRWRQAYYEIVDNYNNGTPISSEILYIN